MEAVANEHKHMEGKGDDDVAYAYEPFVADIFTR